MALPVDRRKRRINISGRTPGKRVQDMRQPTVKIEIERILRIEVLVSFDVGMMRASNHYIPLSYQKLRTDRIIELVHDLDCKVDTPLLEELRNRTGLRVHASDNDSGCGVFQATYQGRDEQISDVVNAADAKISLRGSHVERRAVTERKFDPTQSVGNRSGKCNRASRGHHLTRPAHKKFIVKDVAQSVEGRADGGLAQT